MRLFGKVLGRPSRATLLAVTIGLSTVGLTTGVAEAGYATCVDQRTGSELVANKVGSEGPDVITAESNDVIATLGGDDKVFAGEWDSNVVICLGAGNDQVDYDFTPAAGSLSVMGGPDDDIIRGGNGDDWLNGGSGYNDSVLAFDGYDRCKNAEFTQSCESSF